MSPVPVENEPAGIAPLDYVPVNRKRGMTGNGELYATGLDRSPARGRQTVLRRVDRVTSALAGEKGNEQIRGGPRLLVTPIGAPQEVALPKSLENILGNRNIGAPPRTHLERKLSERKIR